jgi:hypothetical protein
VIALVHLGSRRTTRRLQAVANDCLTKLTPHPINDSRLPLTDPRGPATGASVVRRSTRDRALSGESRTEALARTNSSRSCPKTRVSCQRVGPENSLRVEQDQGLGKPPQESDSGPTLSPLYDVQDILGIRLVCLLREDLTRIDAIIKSTFDLAAPPMTGLATAPSTTVPNPYRPRQRRGVDRPTIVFEIQVRTPGQDAWAAVEHHRSTRANTVFPRR